MDTPLVPKMDTPSPRSIAGSAKQGGEDGGMQDSTVSDAGMHITSEAISGGVGNCRPPRLQPGCQQQAVAAHLHPGAASLHCSRRSGPQCAPPPGPGTSQAAATAYRRELEGPGGSDADRGGMLSCGDTADTERPGADRQRQPERRSGPATAAATGCMITKLCKTCGTSRVPWPTPASHTQNV